MLRLVLLISVIAVAIFSASCGTVYRYEYYDYNEPTVDERNKMRQKKIDRNFRQLNPRSRFNERGDITR